MHLRNILLTVKLSIFVCFTGLNGFAQNTPVKEIDRINTPAKGLAPLRFLASDELMGRGTLRPEIHIAARYISEYFREHGLKEVPGTSDYFQGFTIQTVTPSHTGTLTLESGSFKMGEELLQTRGVDISAEAPVVYVHFGTEADFSQADVSGKIVFSHFGLTDSSSFPESFDAMDVKAKRAADKGAIALIELFQNKSMIPWARLQRFLSRESLRTSASPIPVFILNDSTAPVSASLQTPTTKARISISGTQSKTVPAQNVLAWVEGTDPLLKKQFIVLSAHYDHLGVAKQPKMEEGKLDSIYNGARDNAIGSAAVLDAAAYFVQHPPRRSVIFITYTGEEMGEIGSKYFAAHPAIPLNTLVYNLNIDNASYNDTNIVSVIGLGRTSADKDIEKGCSAFGLMAKPDPAPEQNLFDRSDNTNLAVKGIPAPTFSLGMDKMDAEIDKRYHQLSDEVGNFNLSYAMKFINSFILSAKYIADNPVQPYWIKGDKYEAAWKSLFGK